MKSDQNAIPMPMAIATPGMNAGELRISDMSNPRFCAIGGLDTSLEIGGASAISISVFFESTVLWSFLLPDRNKL
jgi:hypothetical protein